MDGKAEEKGGEAEREAAAACSLMSVHSGKRAKGA